MEKCFDNQILFTVVRLWERVDVSQDNNVTFVLFIVVDKPSIWPV